MLTPSHLKLLSIFTELDQEINMSTFENRLIFQKEVYLLQEFGISLGHSFGWYRRGPYSSDAADDGFKLESIQRNITELPPLSEHERASILRYRDLMRNARTIFSINNISLLELVASLHFILNKGYPRPETPEDAVQQLVERKPHFERLQSQILHFLRSVDLQG